LVCTSSPCSIPMILRFGLLMDLLSSCIFLSQLLNCLSKISFVFSLVLILSLNSEVQSSTCSTLLEWTVSLNSEVQSSTCSTLLEWTSTVFFCLTIGTFNFLDFCLILSSMVFQIYEQLFFYNLCGPL
jgi:hypothetical protein